MIKSYEELYRITLLAAGGREKEVSNKERIISGKAPFLWGRQGVCQAGDLTGADRVIPDWLIKGPIPGRVWNYK